jgi:acetyl-CoA carboxylase biotin carboxyl carrier protein
MTDGERLEAIRRLLLLADVYGLAELEVEEGDLKVTICGAEPGTWATANLPPANELPGRSTEPDEEGRRFHAILSPMTGVFYRAASPEAPPFVEAGDRVEEGQAVGLIEAMKVFSEIPADRSGRILDILVASGQLVSQDDPLILLDPEG